MNDSAALLYCAGGGIGDSLVASVVARALRQRYARVDALTLSGHRETLLRVPDVDEVLVDEGEREVVARRLRERGYAACVVTWATERTASVAQRAGIPVRVGQARRLYSGRFTERVVVRSERGDVTSHWSEILLDFARAIGCEGDAQGYRFEPTEADCAEASAFASGDALILNPCNAVASARGIWPVGGWIALARALLERFGGRVLVSGAPADAAVAEAIVRGAADERVVSIAGKLGIGAFGALARAARGFAGITTGSMHVAAAVGCPTAGIFPFQSDFPERWAPLGRRTEVVRASFACHPGDTKERCRDYACIAHLDVPRVLAAVEALGVT
ncbi:MAG TPA: glycosyltransferase family 9 protein [Verrucomicrobiae bacterium]|nr:glycosyltransferase family 9 protein [Verrucomicrobiae bacterium]